MEGGGGARAGGEEDLYDFDNAGSQGQYMDQPLVEEEQQSIGGGEGNVGGRRNRLAPAQQHNEPTRPMTSVNAAGWPGSNVSQGVMDRGGPMMQQQQQPTGPTVEEQAKQMEKEVNQLLEESADASVRGEYSLALKKAKDTAAKEMKLTKFREEKQLQDQINMDLTFCVRFNLATQYEASKMYNKAIETFQQIVKSKNFPQTGRLRVNIGNIFYKQEQYTEAIKNYRMALDQVPNTSRDLRYKIFRSIGNAFVRMGQFQDAIQSFESVVDGHDFRSGLNLILCHYSLGDKEKMKKSFVLMLTMRRKLMRAPGEALGPPPESEDEEPNDPLRLDNRDRKKLFDTYIISAAQLMAPVIERTFSAGFDWVVDTLRQHHCPDLANQMEISKAMRFIKSKQFDKAVETLKSFETKDQIISSPASTNLAFLYYLENDLLQAEKYAEKAIQSDRYNNKAMVNKGIILASKGQTMKALEYFKEALDIDPDCIEASYNLGLAYKRLGENEMALEVFLKINSVLPNYHEVVFQIAHLYEKSNNVAQSIKWFKLLSSLIPSDANVLSTLGNLHKKDDALAYQYYMDSYRKGSTRAFPPHHPLIPVDYQWTGQPVLIGGTMGTCSYVLTGTQQGMEETFGSTCHGAGRALSRNKSRKTLNYQDVLDNLKQKGISIRVASPKLVMEEAPGSYKDVTEVVNTCHEAGISKKCMKLRPIAVIKG